MKVWQLLAVLKELDPELEVTLIDLFESSETVADYLGANQDKVAIISCVPTGYENGNKADDEQQARKDISAHFGYELQQLPTGEWVDFNETEWNAANRRKS